MQYEYDKVGNRTKLTYPGGSYAIDYYPDALNRISQIGKSGILQAGYIYEKMRRKQLIRYPSGNYAITDYSYNDADWIVGLSNYVVGGSVFSDFVYTYDRAGNRTAMARNGVQNTDQYIYNKRYELCSVDYRPTSPFTDKTYNYDGVGNRMSVVNGGTVTYGINELNQYTNVGGVTHTYDLRGNLTSDGTNSYTYDLDNRLTGVNGTISYTYDPFGRRIRKTVNGTATNYVYDGDRVIEERNGSGNLLRRYVYGVGIDEVLWAEDASGNKFWYYYDALGSVVNISDNSGNCVSTMHYDVYGDFVETGSYTNNPFKFTGRRFDPESGLYFYRARMYSPELGRFLQTDPVGYIDGMNLYSYVINNPLNLFDPLGLDIDNRKGVVPVWYKSADDDSIHFVAAGKYYTGSHDGVIEPITGDVYKLWGKWFAEDDVWVDKEGRLQDVSLMFGAGKKGVDFRRQYGDWEKLFKKSDDIKKIINNFKRLLKSHGKIFLRNNCTE